MQKTKLGISAGLLGAVVYFTGLFSGFLVAVVLTGYILWFEENEWLKKSAVKAVMLLIAFSFVTAVLNLIPNAIGFVDDIFNIFGGNFGIAFITRIITAVVTAINIFEKLLFLGLGLTALNQGIIPVPAVDKLIEKHMG